MGGCSVCVCVWGGGVPQVQPTHLLVECSQTKINIGCQPEVACSTGGRQAVDLLSGSIGVFLHFSDLSLSLSRSLSLSCPFATEKGRPC